MTTQGEISTAPAVSATPEAIAAYQAAVTRLVASCIERVTKWPLPDDAEPLLQWRPRRD
jgi:hypothetical protein